MRRTAVAHERLVDTTDRAPLRDRDRGERGRHVVEPVGVIGQPRPIGQPLLEHDGGHRADEPRVPAGLHLEVDVGERGGLGAPGVDHDQCPVGVAGDLLQRRPGMRDAVRHPRVLADEQRHLGVLEVASA